MGHSACNALSFFDGQVAALLFHRIGFGLKYQRYLGVGLLPNGTVLCSSRAGWWRGFYQCVCL